ncbi:MAG TPA: GNAT family N-acetyltransferase [Ktedonobacterales bacterium]|nr:GNAT family N-acetyltransferase [Ktedonobacterales bacterium]
MTLTREHNLAVRPPTEANIPSILALIAADDIAHTGEADPWSADDIRSEWIGVDLDHDAWIIETADGQVVGYAMLFYRATDGNIERFHLDSYVHPAFTGRGIGTDLLRRLEARARELVTDTPSDRSVVLQSGTIAHDTAARRLLESRGYNLVRHFWRMRIDMTGAPPTPRWPEGITVRECVAGQDERVFFDTLEEAFQDHWGHTPHEYGEWLKHNVKTASFDPSLWFLALDGMEPAGALRGKQMADGSGWVNTLGVRRPWRKRGLGRALLLQAFDTFYRRGVSSVALGVDAQNPTGATHVYEAAGMRIVREFAIYEKQLRAGAAPASESERSTQETIS